MQKLILITATLALAACGPSPEKKTTEALRTWELTESQFRTQCLAMDTSARISSDGTNCLLSKITPLAPGAGNPVEIIDPDFEAGNYVVATATTNAGAVSLGLDRQQLNQPIPSHFVGERAGELSFLVNSPAYSDVSVTVWTCYDRNLHRVGCNDKVVPH